MHRLARVARPARTLRTLFSNPTRQLSSLEALRVVRVALKNGEDADLALQAALGFPPPLPPPPPMVAAILPTGDTHDVPLEFEQEEADDFPSDVAPDAEPEYSFPIPPVEPDLRLWNVHIGAYPRLAAHALIHGHIREGRILEAGTVAYIQLRHGVKLAPQTLEILIDALCPPSTVLPGIPFKPTITIDPLESTRIFDEGLSSFERDLDTGTAMARLLLKMAREEGSPRSWTMYRSVLDGILIQRRLATAAMFYATLCHDWQLHTELLRRRAPVAESSIAELQQVESATASEASPEPVPVPDPEYEPPFNERDLADAERMGFGDAAHPPPPPHRRLLTRVIQAVLRPEIVDMRRPDKRITVAPTWDRDSIIAIFLLVELIERRRLPIVDISQLIIAAGEALRAGIHGVPVKIHRGEIRRVKAQNHIESVMRSLLYDPVVRKHQQGSWDLMLPFKRDTFHELLGFGLDRKVPEMELQLLVDGMYEADVKPDYETRQILLQRCRLSQNKIVDAVLERMERE